VPDSAAVSKATPRRRRRLLGYIGWVTLALVSFCITYALLVVGGR
jgi:hypothetical protein